MHMGTSSRHCDLKFPREVEIESTMVVKFMRILFQQVIVVDNSMTSLITSPLSLLSRLREHLPHRSLLHCGPPWAAWGQPPPPWIAPGAAEEPVLAPAAPPPSPG